MITPEYILTVNSPDIKGKYYTLYSSQYETIIKLEIIKLLHVIIIIYNITTAVLHVHFNYIII